MQIKEATPADMPEILKVLKASLGEVSSRKTEDVWRFKHVDNPFGPSLVLVAIENNQIIGVRAFMQWRWQLKSQVFKTYRAVDTATHPDHQGKGVFKKLTLHALALGAKFGYHFVFNTPNQLSRPGYYKMGWQEVGKIKVSLAPANPLNWIIKGGAQKDIVKEDNFLNQEELERLVDSNNLINSEQGQLFTPKTTEYLNWRYRLNPLQEYLTKSSGNFYLAAYIKIHKNKFKELRVVECISEDKIGRSRIKEQIRMWARKYRVHVISSSPHNKIPGFSIKGKIGPILTVKQISLEEKTIKKLTTIMNWNYSFGDLELF